MKRPESLDTIFAEIDELMTIVSYGKQKLEEFAEQTQQFTITVAAAETREQLKRQSRGLTRFKHSLDTTQASLIEWKEKTSHYLRIIHQLANEWKTADAGCTVDLCTIESKITHLLMMITGQLRRVKHLQEKNLYLSGQLVAKQAALKPRIERGRAPQLVLEEPLPIRDWLTEPA